MISLRLLCLCLCILLISRVNTVSAADAAPPDANKAAVCVLSPTEMLTKLQQCEERPCLTRSVLQQRKLAKFHQALEAIKAQRALIADFERYAAWMNNNLAAYNRYIQAGSAAAAVTKFLPIPYAGQAALFSKFVAQFSQSLGTTSKALDLYLKNSQQIIEQASRLDGTKPDPKALAELHAAAETGLVKSMEEANRQLKGIAELSSGAQAFLVGLNSYLATGDEYLNKVKGVFKKESSHHDRNFLTESTSALKSQTELFNTRLKNFEALGTTINTTIKSLGVYDELAAELH